MRRTSNELVNRARQDIPEVSVQEVKSRLDTGERFVLLDVRDKDEHREGHIEGSLHVSRGLLEFRVHSLVPNPDEEIVVYCAAGLRSLLAAQTLKSMGYSAVSSMAGGFQRWREAGYPLVVPKTFSPEQQVRYSRHFTLPEVGEEGQRKLLDARVLLIGAGGLGCAAGYYLAAAGVGTLGIVDSDAVELSNLQRQILHTTHRVGRPKAESAKETLNALNPDVEVITYAGRLTRENIFERIEGYDIVVDGSDNFPTRYLVNDACVLAGKPVVHGSIFQFEGQASVFIPGSGPCYRCLYPTPPPPGLVPT